MNLPAEVSLGQGSDLMPEGPEVRRYADLLAASLTGSAIRKVSARTRQARSWLDEHGESLDGRRLTTICSRGKHLIGYIEGNVYFHSHLMMWGRWRVDPSEPEFDRRERARIVTEAGTAVLSSAPVFEIGSGDPFENVEHLRSIGPDILPYEGIAAFDRDVFRRRLLSPAHCRYTIGAALLDQQLVAGIGNYLRCEILYCCGINPWRTVSALSEPEIGCLSATIPLLARRAYERSGTTVSDEEKQRLGSEPGLVYQAGREYGTRHYVFRRTNLPCLRCGSTIRQQRQVTRFDEEGEHTRITYFCPDCQGVDVEPRAAARAARSSSGRQRRA
ncbi:MAG TPA: DNA-formamidopyrimidine glycosylase family protein [Candidatus Limnocylindrales bacterium]|nr:DNA-formamidopyrimidine glycosylase family protein [Candidatus Limnocylindrales bacterium]